MKCLWSEQDMVKSLVEFANGCIPMHCGAHVFNVSDVLSKFSTARERA